ncbi:hypothetical protein [Anaeroselena agilis]|uniref:Uncharacterized protein n=1 Tax=Anaeroselena agilis TaxID=3063788 RepID=A0ABU3NWE5_9FIRM|nr:hypothetical protein [Selenomonadales bacterium 4137-cl]
MGKVLQLAGQRSIGLLASMVARWRRQRRRRNEMQVKRVTHEGCFAEFFARGGQW